MEIRCPSHQTRHTWPLVPKSPVRSGCSDAERIRQFEGHVGRIHAVQFSPVDPFWHQHLMTIRYDCGICMSLSPRAGITSSPALLCLDLEPSLPPAPMTGCRSSDCRNRTSLYGHYAMNITIMSPTSRCNITGRQVSRAI